jgi:uncharacterized membrane protein YraQ (UPF0718 family)
MMIAGGAMAIASAFLPRITASGPGGEATYGGIAGAGIGTMILAGLAIVKGLQVARPDVVRTRLGSPILTGVLMVVLAAIRYSTLRSDIDSLQAFPGVTASIGIGYWLGVLGAIIVLGGGAMIRFDERPG